MSVTSAPPASGIVCFEASGAEMTWSATVTTCWLDSSSHGLPHGDSGSERDYCGRSGHQLRPPATPYDPAEAAGEDRREWTDGRDVGEHPVAQTSRRRGRRGGTEEAGRFGEGPDLFAAVGTVGEVSFEPGPLEVVERVDDVGAGQGVDVGVHEATPIASRSRIRPSRILVLAVPTGRSSMVATSVCV